MSDQKALADLSESIRSNDLMLLGRIFALEAMVVVAVSALVSRLPAEDRERFLSFINRIDWTATDLDSPQKLADAQTVAPIVADSLRTLMKQIIATVGDLSPPSLRPDGSSPLNLQ